MSQSRLMTECRAWELLKHLGEEFRGRHIRDLFDRDPQRTDGLTFEAGQLWADFSKQRLDANVLGELLKLAEEREMTQAIADLFSGKPVNITENKPAGHWRLRASVEEAGEEVCTQLARMETIVDQIHGKQWRGVLGDPITDVVNLGVGGSDLGPLMVSTALDEHVPAKGERPRVHFVSSMDGSQLSRLLTELNPRHTLFVVASKSFTTRDTMANADAALGWLRGQFGSQGPELIRSHFIGVSAQPALMTQWGIPAGNQLQLWDWVGGRLSLWSSIGLTIALRIGMPAFKELLAGARFVDEHFKTAPLSANLPVLTALVDIWNINCLDIRARAVLPYDARLKFLPHYQEQLEMESNGKSVSTDGRELDYQTCPVIWGDVGTNAQHAFYQLLHQGTQSVACEFVLTGLSGDGACAVAGSADQHRLSQANCMAQSHLLAFGSGEDVADSEDLHRRYQGNQPSTTIYIGEFGPESIGQLLALLEHRVYAQAVLWGVNAFDQWGVERGKRITGTFEKLLSTKSICEGERVKVDASSIAIAKRLKGL